MLDTTSKIILIAYFWTKKNMLFVLFTNKKLDCSVIFMHRPCFKLRKKRNELKTTLYFLYSHPGLYCVFFSVQKKFIFSSFFQLSNLNTVQNSDVLSTLLNKHDSYINKEYTVTADDIEILNQQHAVVTGTGNSTCC